MPRTARSLLGALILKPELIQSLGDFDAAGLFTPDEAVVFRTISDLWEDGHPEEINPAILVDRITGKVKDPATFVGSLLEGMLRSTITPDGVRQCVRELRMRHVGKQIIHQMDQLKDTWLGKGEPDKEGVHHLLCRAFEWENLTSGNDDAMRPNLINLGTVEAEMVEWLWPGRIPLGKVTLLSGNPGTGKSYFALDLAARITTGRQAPDGQSIMAGSCLFLVGEDGLEDTIRVRADILKADCSKIIVLDGVKHKNQTEAFRFDRHLEALEYAIRTTPEIKLVVIDPVSSFLGKYGKNDAGDTRAIMDPLAKLAGRLRFSALLLDHLNKAQTLSAAYRTSGSQQWSAAPRAVYYLAEDPAEENFGRRILDNIKVNLGKKPHKLSFVIGEHGPEDYKIEKDDYRSADEILQTQPSVGTKSRALKDAAQWLKSQLKDGPRSASELEELARAEDISHSTLRRAKKELGVDAYQGGGGFPKHWFWMLPSRGETDAQN